MENSKNKQSARYGNVTVSSMTPEEKELLKVFVSRVGTKDNPTGKVQFTPDEFKKIMNIR